MKMNQFKSLFFMFTLIMGHAYGQGWNEVQAPNASGQNQLFGVTAVGPSEAFAVGYSGNDAIRNTLVLHILNGKVQVMSTPNNSGFAINELRSVWASGPCDVWAAGRLINPSTLPTATLILHYDCVSWKIISSPNPDSGSNELFAIAGTSSTNIYAGGSHSSINSDSVTQNLLLHFNGTSWNVITNFPNPSGTGVNNEIEGLSASASNNVWAVGVTGNTGSSIAPFAFQFNGTNWMTTKVVPHNSGASQSFFSGVATNSPSDVWAVGRTVGTSTLPNFQHWNGASWTQFFWRKLDSSMAINNVTVLGVSCSGTTCYSVGQIQGSALILKWDPASGLWLQVQAAVSPNPEDLFGISLFPRGSAFTAGIQFPGSTGQQDNLIEQNPKP